jgi:hypothetical protein
LAIARTHVSTKIWQSKKLNPQNLETLHGTNFPQKPFVGIALDFFWSSSEKNLPHKIMLLVTYYLHFLGQGHDIMWLKATSQRPYIWTSLNISHIQDT